MAASHRHGTRIGTVALVLVLGLTVSMTPAMALTGASSAVSQAEESTPLETALEEQAVPAGVGPGETLTLDATAIADRDDVAKACWKIDEETDCRNAETTETFDEVGYHTATLIVVDSEGDRSSITDPIVVTTTPTAELSVPESAETGTAVQFDASDSTDDHGVEAYEWDLTGDGTIDETTTSPNLNHTFEAAGTHDLTVTTVDVAGQTDTASATIEVADSDTASSEEAAESGLPGTTIVALAIGILATAGIATYVVTRNQE